MEEPSKNDDTDDSCNYIFLILSLTIFLFFRKVNFTIFSTHNLKYILTGKLVDTSVPAFLANLKTRYKKNKIYVSAVI